MKSVSLSPPLLALLALALIAPWILVIKQATRSDTSSLDATKPLGEPAEVADAESDVGEEPETTADAEGEAESNLLSEKALDQLILRESAPLGSDEVAGSVWGWDDEGNATMLPLNLVELAGGDLEDYALDDLEAMERELEARQKELDELEIQLSWEAENQTAQERWLAEQELAQAESAYWVGQQWVPDYGSYYSTITPYYSSYIPYYDPFYCSYYRYPYYYDYYDPYCYYNPWRHTWWGGPIIVVDTGFRKRYHHRYHDRYHRPYDPYRPYKGDHRDHKDRRDYYRRGDDWRRDDPGRNRQLVGNDYRGDRERSERRDGLVTPTRPRTRTAAETAERERQIADLEARMQAQRRIAETRPDRTRSASSEQRLPQPRAEQATRAMQGRQDAAERERRQELAEQQRRQNLAELQTRAAELRRRREIAALQDRQAEQQQRIEAQSRGRLGVDQPGTVARAGTRSGVPSLSERVRSSYDRSRVPSPSSVISPTTRSVPRATPSTRSRVSVVPTPSRSISQPTRSTPSRAISRPTAPQPRSTARSSISRPSQSISRPTARPTPRPTMRSTPSPTTRSTARPSVSSSTSRATSSRSTRGGPFRR